MHGPTNVKFYVYVLGNAIITYDMALVALTPHADKKAKIILENIGKFTTELFKDDKYRIESRP
jgi:hypothetical protein